MTGRGARRSGGSVWRNLLGWNKHPSHERRGLLEDTRRRLLPAYVEDNIESAIPPAEVTKIAIRLHHLVEQCIPCEMEEELVTRSHSKIINKAVIKAAKEAGGEEYRGCVVFCLLICKRWFRHQALAELWDASMHQVRGIACEVIAKQIIENEEDTEYLMHSVLLKRYAILIDQEPTLPSNVIEKAVDLHALRVIGSSGYQKCIGYLWRGWLVQDEDDPSNFVDYKGRDDTSFLSHMDPDRMRAPMYQNAAQMLLSLIYLGLFTIAINTINRSGDLDFVEVVLYLFTFGFLFDEISKIWKAGYYILGFWDAFNGLLYSLLLTSLALRFVAFSKPSTGDVNFKGPREHYNELSYNFLAFSAPMFWIRLLLYLDSFRFFGAMLVVLKVMMKESVIFFALLIVILVGFLQSFIGLDIAEDHVLGDIGFIVQAMANAVMQSPDFEGFEQFGHPFGIILYYCFTFIVMVVLLNILIALYNSAYEDIYENADDEYLALFAQKTMQFVRAPDENVFIPPLNLIEIFCLALPFEWWMSKRTYEKLNDYVMAALYSPLLVLAAYFETRQAREIQVNRLRGDADDDIVEEWEQLGLGLGGDAAGTMTVDFEADGWNKTVERVRPNVEDELAVLEVRELRSEVAELKLMLTALTRSLGTSAVPQLKAGESSKTAETLVDTE
ncbi:potassium ion channel [Grosmannia clavigera kw1407]|uniref:Potassium ion channel n=1 Tax=Grosmannia clavigera (strain kw1407 / UAMH 11150) TaxID=655863 RepID=F0XCC8_GROCL|nr:potassium ion channel [Grosmannia clavigera kw1407]EFX04001.1 potassium ion channel [Grosmannia clavigera kw1407]